MHGSSKLEVSTRESGLFFFLAGEQVWSFDAEPNLISKMYSNLLVAGEQSGLAHWLSVAPVGGSREREGAGQTDASGRPHRRFSTVGCSQACRVETRQRGSQSVQRLFQFAGRGQNLASTARAHGQSSPPPSTRPRAGTVPAVSNSNTPQQPASVADSSLFAALELEDRTDRGGRPPGA